MVSVSSSKEGNRKGLTRCSTYGGVKIGAAFFSSAHCSVSKTKDLAVESHLEMVWHAIIGSGLVHVLCVTSHTSKIALL